MQMNALLNKVNAKEFVYNDTVKLHLTATIDAARHHLGQSLDAWANLADTRLYNGKQTGKNQVVNADI